MAISGARPASTATRALWSLAPSWSVWLAERSSVVKAICDQSASPLARSQDTISAMA